LLGIENPRPQNLQGSDFSSGKWDFPAKKSAPAPGVHAAGLDLNGGTMWIWQKFAALLPVFSQFSNLTRIVQGKS